MTRPADPATVRGRHHALRWRSSVGCALRWIAPLTLLLGCAPAYRLERSAPTMPSALSARHAHTSVLQPIWRRKLVEEPLLSYEPQEWAAAAIDPRGTLYIGSSSRRFFALRGSDGSILWDIGVAGGVTSEAIYDRATDAVYFGADDGKLYAVAARTGHLLWTYATQGVIKRRPALSEGLVLFTTSENRIYALNVRDGSWRWQYDREAPEGFTITGYAGVLLRDGVAYTGFSDGVVVALRASTGEALWTRSLSSERGEEFADADATPLWVNGSLIVTSYAAGVYALAPATGSVLWHVPLPAAEASAAVGRQIFVTTPKAGLVALDDTGHELWRQTVPGLVPGGPAVALGYVLLASSRAGLYVASATTGDLVARFDPGRGISAALAYRDGLLVALSNTGSVYAFTLR